MEHKVLKFNEYIKNPIKVLDEDSDRNKVSPDGHLVFFTEALNALDLLMSIVVSISPEEEASLTRDYSKSIKKLGDLNPTLDGIKKGLWDKIEGLAKSMQSKVPEKISSNSDIQEIKKRKDDLDSKLKEDKIDKDEYESQLAKLRKEAISRTDQGEILTLGSYAKAGELLVGAIEKFKNGAYKELDLIAKEGESALQDVVDGVSGICQVSRDKNVKKTESQAKERRREEKEKYRISDKQKNKIQDKRGGIPTIGESLIIETFGGFLDQVGRGVKSLKDQTVFANSKDPNPITTNSILTAAENIKSSLIAIASEMDNVISYKNNIGIGDDESKNADFEKAKSEANEKFNKTKKELKEKLKNGEIDKEEYEDSLKDAKEEYDKSVYTADEKKAKNLASNKTVGSASPKYSLESEKPDMVSFVRDSFKYVYEIDSHIKDDSTKNLKKVKDKLDSISKGIREINSENGQLEEWKNEVMGAGRENIIAASDLSFGKSLVNKAKEIIDKVINRKYLQNRLKETEPVKIIKSALKALAGEDDDEEKISLIKTKGSYKTFPKNPSSSDADVIKSFQERLKKINLLGAGYKEGSYDDQTSNATNRGMVYLGAITGKTYDMSDNGFKEFQRDLGTYTDHEKEISKKLGFSR